MTYACLTNEILTFVWKQISFGVEKSQVNLQKYD